MTPFTGLTGHAFRSGYVELSESAYEARVSQPRHAHDPAYFTAVLAGGYEETIGARSRVVRAGELLHHPAGEEHEVRFQNRPTRVFRVRPLPALLEAAQYARARFEACIADATTHALVQRMRVAALGSDPAAPLEIDALACELVARGAGGTRSNDRGAERARDAIEADLNRNIPLAELAALAGCHAITLTRAFRRAYGCSIGEYVRRRRLQAACDALRHTSTPISIIALRCGFADQAHLTRTLRRATGITPGALRTFNTEKRQAR